MKKLLIITAIFCGALFLNHNADASSVTIGDYPDTIATSTDVAIENGSTQIYGMGQSFTVTSTMSVAYIKAKFVKYNTPPGSMSAKIYTFGTTTEPRGSLVATSLNSFTSANTPSGSVYSATSSSFTFATSLTAGTYFVWFQVSQTSSAYFNFAGYDRTPEKYSGGKIYYYGPATGQGNNWVSAPASRDLLFEVGGSGGAMGKIYWAGVGTEYGLVGGQWSIPFYWDICDDYSRVSTTAAYMEIHYQGLNTTQILSKQLTPQNFGEGPQTCKGYDYLTGEVPLATPQTGTSTIYMVDTPIDFNVYAQSGVVNWTVSQTGNNGDYISTTLASPITMVNGTTTIPIIYNLTNSFATSSQICLLNKQNGQKTNLCSTITSKTGTTSISIYSSIPGNITIENQLMLYDTNNNVLFWGDSLTLSWPQWTAPTILESTGTSTNSMVCTADEWASEDVLIKVKCNFLSAVLNIGETIAKIPANFANGISATMKNMFPINIPWQFLTSWNESASATLPNDLAWLTPADGNGNVYVDMPEMFGAGQKMAVWGPASYDNNAKLIQVFGYLKSLSVYLLWLLVIAEIVNLGKKILSDVSGEEIEFNMQKTSDRERQDYYLN